MNGEEEQTARRHVLEHRDLADEAVVHAGKHRAELGNDSMFDLVDRRATVWAPAMDLAIKAHLGFLESISHSLIALTEQLRVANNR